MWKLILVASLLALADGAALVRFINTVPTRTSNPSVNAGATAGATALTGRLTGIPAVTGAALVDYPSYNLISDRVGLNYYATSGTGYASPTVVWTTFLESSDVLTTTTTTATSPYYWHYAMPALRGYHALATGATPTEAAATDKPLGTLVATGNTVKNADVPVDQWDQYDQTRLRADGVGLYLSFAAGQYRLEAYGVMADSTNLISSVANKFTASASTFTFEDNKVYTIVAYGNAAFDAAIAYTGANVKLALLEESVAATTFGKAALRFFHAVQAESANSIDVYLGDMFVANKKIASSIAFGTVSSYVDVSPSIEVELQVGVAGSVPRQLGSGTPVKRDVRAGSRLTVICAQNNLVSSATSNPVFCRGIPSRAVAYVRLLNDFAGQKSVVQGKFFPQKLSETPISLWASYDVPHGDQVYEQSQVMADSVFTNHPATSEGLYPVVKNVAAGTVSGYGEVFVPLPIMDFAIRWVIGTTYDALFLATTAATNILSITTSTAGNKSPASPVSAAQTHFFFAPMLKRVHFLIKTNGDATLSGSYAKVRNVNPFVVLPATATRTFAASTDSKTVTPAYVGSIDEYVEPGQYYTIFAYPAKTASTVETAAATRYDTTLTLPVTAYQDAAIARFAIRLDHTQGVVATASTVGIGATITAGKGLLSFVPFFRREAGAVITAQEFKDATSVILKQGTIDVQTITMTSYGKNRAFVMRSTTGDTTADDVADSPATLAAVTAQTTADANGDAAYIAVTNGTYTLSYTLAGSTCYTTVPTGQTITITDQTITDLFVLNTFGCLENSDDKTLLSVVTAVRSSAAATGHSPTTKRSVETEAAVPLYNSASASGSSFLLALAALVLAMFAF